MLITKTDIIEEGVSHIRNLSSVFGQDQSQWKIVVFFLCVILSNIVHANTGVFLGSGCEVIPFRNDHIQLKGEEVFITVTIPKNSAEFGVGFIPRLYVKADFHLYNTSVEKIPLQLGFPVVTSEDPSDPHKMNFQVGSSGQTYTTQIKKGAIEKSLDPSGSFKQVIVWNDNFEPRGMKDIKVTYDLSMSLVLLDTNRKLGAYGLTFFFPYITKTAYTWKQPLEKAVFRFDFSDIISYLNSSKHSEQVIFKEEQNNFSGPCLIYLRYPIGGEISNSILTMTYNDRVPEEGLIYYIDAVNLPATLTGFESYFKIMPEVYERANKNTFHKKPYDETEILWNCSICIKDCTKVKLPNLYGMMVR